MITPDEVRAKASRKFVSLCRNWIAGEDMYPLPIRANLKPSGVSESILKDGWKKLYEGSKEHTGKNGYVLEFKEVNTRLRGVQNQPDRLIIPSREDHLDLIGRNAAFRSFCNDVEAIQDFLVDEDRSWCTENTSLILRHPGEWGTIIQVVRYLEENPEAVESLREIPVADSKFAESRKRAVLALAEARSPDLGITLESRWGGPSNWRPTIRFVDPNMRFGGLTRITIELSELASLLDKLNPNGLFIIENRTSFDALPEIPGILALWGEGNAVQALKKAGLPINLSVFYWGDIDREGLAILSRLRRILPKTQSVAMNIQTLEIHHDSAVIEDSHVGTMPEGLNGDEAALYRCLGSELLGNQAIRLEQERISPDYVLNHFTFNYDE
jgi:hypothetical protein